MVLNGIFGSQWYTVRLFFTIQITIETNTFTVDILNDAEWYWTVLNGTERYFKCSMVYRSLSSLPSKVPLNGTERYRRALHGIPLGDFDEILYY